MVFDILLILICRRPETYIKCSSMYNTCINALERKMIDLYVKGISMFYDITFGE